MAAASNSTRRVKLTPKPGFVIKTTSTLNGTYTTSLGTPALSSPSSPSAPQTVPETIAVHKGYKIFLNICWDPQVPPPPERNEDEIRKAMMGADMDDGMYFIPVIVSDGKTTMDKAGKPSLVFDCVFNSNLKGRATKDFEFRIFLTEIALERVEDKSRLTLSREIATPNIASKGALEPRTVSIPTAVPSPKPLIQEISATPTPPTTTPKGILKPSSQKGTLPAAATSAGQREVPKWSAEVDNSGVVVVIITPKFTKTCFNSPQTSPTLDVEPCRIIFILPNIYELDLRLNPAAGKLSAVKGKVDENTPVGQGGSGRALDPDGAIAEWRVDKGVVVVKIPWGK
ncbi:hypothetical protein M407DRAFT_18931 [Tulasnella calospora MUT 4182]|uniref:PIH1 N-terminal domain-containing protein n=1 Tax=Tulasnella calospora MUT 4182 TaxID=1051891 RepID=A0A0C3QIX9_9AGAM|nr:hypothetical protein M407DRAFT_18931 [Tulasnella calospora MUT 4182]